MADNSRPFNLDRIQVVEATAAALLASAIVSTFGGVAWLVFKLPGQLTSLEKQLQQLITTVSTLDADMGKLESRVDDHERRLLRLER